jgi:hypothetical protein
VDKSVLPPLWTPLNYHELQCKAWNSKKRFVVLPCGRGSGKTELARRRIILHLAMKKPWPNPIYVYTLPTYAQAKRVAWKPILQMIPEEWIKKDGVNATDMAIETIFGSTLYIAGMDSPKRIEGLQIDGGVSDESSDTRPDAFETTIMPMLTHRNAWFWRIGVPKRFGVGAISFKNYFDLGMQGHPEIDSYTWSSSSVLPPEKLAILRDTLSPKDYAEQVDATWQSIGGLIFYGFHEEYNVSEEAQYDPSKPIVVGSDFNVNPMCWVLAHRDMESGILRVFDELFIRNTNTPETMDELYNRYGITHQGGWEFFGDAAGKARKTSATRSDYIIIKNDARFAPKKVYYAQSNPRQLDRFAACNALLCNANQERNLLVHPKCVQLIQDLQVRAFKQKPEESSRMEPDDYGDIGHMSDALGYIVIRLFPLTVRRSSAPVVIMS